MEPYVVWTGFYSQIASNEAVASIRERLVQRLAEAAPTGAGLESARATSLVQQFFDEYNRLRRTYIANQVIYSLFTSSDLSKGVPAANLPGLIQGVFSKTVQAEVVLEPTEILMTIWTTSAGAACNQRVNVVRTAVQATQLQASVLPPTVPVGGGDDAPPADGIDFDKLISGGGSGGGDTPMEYPLPPGLVAGFGGVDVRQATFSPVAIKAGTVSLFDLEDLSDSVPVELEFLDPIKMNPSVIKKHAVPRWLSFSQLSRADSFFVGGNSKAEFKENLSGNSNIKVEGLFDTYDGEFDRSFSTTSYDEDFRKYAIYYDRHTLYSVTLVADNVVDHLRQTAIDDFKNHSAEEIVRRYGTHYMTEAYFGGVRIFSASLNVRDQLSEQDLSESLKFKVKGDVGTLSASDTESSDRSQKISTVLEHYKRTAIGGQDLGETEDWKAANDPWIHSLNLRPSVIGYQLAPLADLVRKVTKDEEKAKQIEGLYSASPAPMKTPPLLAMRVRFEPPLNDHGTHSDTNMVVARPAVPPEAGWFYLGQYAVQGWDFPSEARGLVFKVWPGTEQSDRVKSLLRACDGFNRVWGTSRGFGLFVPSPWPTGGGFGALGAVVEEANQGFSHASVGAVFAATDDVGNVRDDSLGVVRSDLLEQVSPAGFIWDDKGGGANDSGSVWGIPMPEDQTYQAGGRGVTPRLFLAQSKYEAPATVSRIRPDCYKVIDGTYLSDLLPDLPR